MNVARRYLRRLTGLVPPYVRGLLPISPGDSRQRLVILLEEYNAIYFPVPKVACSSIKTHLARAMGLDKVYEESQIKAAVKNEWTAPVHEMTFPTIKKEALEAYEDYWKFCFVRNPWDRLVSCYEQKIKKDPVYNQGPYFVDGVDICLLKHGNKFKGGMSFEKFVDSVSGISDDVADGHIRSQSTFLKSGDKILVDFVGRFERLTQDFSFVCDKLGLQDKELSHLLKMQRKDYREYYTSGLIEKVRQRYRSDIEMFGYDF